MEDNFVPQEVIVVEGRDDTKRLIETFGPDIKTIETNGSALEPKVLEQIIQADAKYGVVVFTDPDFQGDRLRRRIRQVLPQVKEAHLTRQEAHSDKRHASLGIEHASPENIRQALAKVSQASPVTEREIIPLKQLMDLKLIGHPEAKALREAVSQHFYLGHMNGKQLQQQLRKYGIGYEDLVNFLDSQNKK